MRRKNFKPLNENETKGKLVGVHWNSHENCWSVVNFKSRKNVGLLAGHVEQLVLKDVSFKVDLAKKKKAIEKGSKDRHTFIVGILNDDEGIKIVQGENKLKYTGDNINPFETITKRNVLGETLYFSSDSKVYMLKN